MILGTVTWPEPAQLGQSCVGWTGATLVVVIVGTERGQPTPPPPPPLRLPHL